MANAQHTAGSRLTVSVIFIFFFDRHRHTQCTVPDFVHPQDSAVDSPFFFSRSFGVTRRWRCLRPHMAPPPNTSFFFSSRCKKNVLSKGQRAKECYGLFFCRLCRPPFFFLRTDTSPLPFRRSAGVNSERLDDEWGLPNRQRTSDAPSTLFFSSLCKNADNNVVYTIVAFFSPMLWTAASIGGWRRGGKKTRPRSAVCLVRRGPAGYTRRVHRGGPNEPLSTTEGKRGKMLWRSRLTAGAEKGPPVVESGVRVPRSSLRGLLGRPCHRDSIRTPAVAAIERPRRDHT